MFALDMPVEVVGGAEAIDPRAAFNLAHEWFAMLEIVLPATC